MHGASERPFWDIVMVAMPVNQSIRRITPIMTGWGETHREHRLGTRLPQLWWVLTSRSWERIPLLAFAIEHKDGLVLFDSGMDPAVATDPNYVSSSIGRMLLKRLFRFHIKPEDALGQQLRANGYDPSSVRKVVASHLHWDHIGGIADVPQAELLVSRDEWLQLSTEHPERDWILKEHINVPGAKWRPIDFTPTEDPVLTPFGGAFDVMGDGSMMLISTPGHTPGSMSMLVRTAGAPPLLLVGDLTYRADLLMKDQVPGVGDVAQLRASYSKVRALKEHFPDLIILPSHDDSSRKALTALWPDAIMNPKATAKKI